MTNAPRYIRHKDFHRVLGIPDVASEIKINATKYKPRLFTYINVEFLQLLDN